MSAALRIGVAGAGKWGMNVVRSCAKLGVLAAVCDADLHPLEEVRGRYEGVRVFCDYETMLRLARPDAVIVAAPVPAHAEMALQAIAAGIPVLVEKPLALNVGDAQRVVDTARAAGVPLAVGHVLLYHPLVRLMLQTIREGRIGDVRHFRSRRASWGRLRAHEDVWWSFAPHDVAVMLEVFGEEPATVTAGAGAYVRPHIADLTYADFGFSLGRTAHVEVTWIDPDKTSRFDVFGSRGVLSFTDGAQPRLTLTPCGDRLGTRGEPELWREETMALDAPAAEPLLTEIEAFCSAIGGGPALPTPGEEGLAVVRTLARVHEYPSTPRLEAIS
ncbi:MAG TPA: Gfo/Idh/MocA family oxidoreductase [Candidatus Acidoferrales bacterium]|nr:Gfo/Idh/MocA family oxidoreductase [Candidatus Acidoferrales bacterium]